MKCGDSMMKYTGYLHILALIVAIYGTYSQIDAVKSGLKKIEAPVIKSY